jgi:hypothetical protein
VLESERAMRNIAVVVVVNCVLGWEGGGGNATFEINGNVLGSSEVVVESGTGCRGEIVDVTVGSGIEITPLFVVDITDDAVDVEESASVDVDEGIDVDVDDIDVDIGNEVDIDVGIVIALVCIGFIALDVETA